MAPMISADEQGGRPVADAELLADQVAGRGAQGEGEQDRQPVEGLAADRDDAVDRQGPLGRGTRPRR